jgi:hypothetical protein
MARHATAAFLLTIGLSLAQDVPLRLQPDPDHPIASALAGTWTADPGLQQRLGATNAPESVTFVEDPSVLPTLPPAVRTQLAGRRLYATGRITLKGREQIYVLGERAGATEVLTYRPGAADPLRSSEAMFVMLVRGRVPASDLLFVNGDVGRQPFAAFRREVPTPPKLEPAAAITEMARLLESKQYEQFLQTWCLPEDVSNMAGSRPLAEAAAKWAETKGALALEALLAASKLTPVLNAAGDEAVFEGEGLQRQLRLQRIEGRWYLCNR